MQFLIIILIAIIGFLAYFLGWFSEEPEVAAANTAVAVTKTVDAADTAVTRLREQKSAFAGIIGNFEQESGALESVLETGKESLLSFKSAIQEARDKDAEFNKVYTHWDAVEQKTIHLQARFRQLVQGAEDFYKIVRERANSISDEKLRSESIAFIQKSELAYAAQLEKTKGAIAQVDGMKVKVDDTMKALEIRFAVDVIDQRLGEMFAEIDSMIESVLAALKELEAESKEVLGSVA